ncbi:MAG TPA: hypothetical protein VGI92_08050 [Gemmatimonadales bacterium]
MVTSACKDIPLLPQWDADWNVPLPSQSLVVPPSVIPSGFSVPVSFPTQRDSLNQSVGSLLQNAADTGSVQMTLIKQPSLALSGNMSLQIDTTNAFGASTITIPVTFAAASDTTVATAGGANLAMVRAAANDNGALFVKLSGTVSNPGPGNVTVTAANGTITVKLAVISLIHVSR